MQSQPSTKDRNGADTHVGDVIYFLRGSLPRETSYETSAVVQKIDTRARRILVDSGDTLYWYEFWHEE